MSEHFTPLDINKVKNTQNVINSILLGMLILMTFVLAVFLFVLIRKKVAQPPVRTATTPLISPSPVPTAIPTLVPTPVATASPTLAATVSATFTPALTATPVISSASAR